MPKERQTCTECSMRRQKCDRQVPCSRCIKRGEPDKCTREWPTGGYDPKKHRIYPRPNTKGGTDSPGTNAGSDDELDSPTSPASRAQTGDLRAPEAVTTPEISNGVNTCTLPPLTNQQSSNGQDHQPGVLEFLTWGRGNLSDYQVKTFDLLREPWKNNGKSTVSDQEYSNGFGNTNAQQISVLQLLLPRREQLFHLVDYHIDTVLWYHACFHGESFRNELSQHYLHPNGLQIQNTDLRWSGLLFAVMSASMACVDDKGAANWGFQRAERHKLMRQWYKASLTCLNLADYMWRHHINSVSAICVLTMSGHILGFSNTQSTLHGAALKIGQGLGLQRLGPEQDEVITNDSDLTPARREKIIRREVGRRVWGQLCNQDWFSIPFSEMYTIQRSHFSTTRPQHIDDHTLLPVPAHEPSSTSFTRCLNDIAAIMPQTLDALTNASTLYTKYEQVLHYDMKMRSLETNSTPSFFSSAEPLRPEWPRWVPWARRSLSLCLAHKTVMIHRSFLGKSLTDPTFDHTRKRCMEASRTIVREAMVQDNYDGPRLWIEQAFMVAAGITLSLDIFHRKPTDSIAEDNRKHVEQAIEMLSNFEYSMIAVRGVRLLTSLLAEQARLCAEKSMDSFKKRGREEDYQVCTSHASNFSFIQGGSDGSSFTNALKRQKFDVPKFLESFVGGGKPSYTGGEEPTPSSVNSNGDLVLGNGKLGNVLMQQPQANQLPPLSQVTSPPAAGPASMDPMVPPDYGYEAFEQIFPPHAEGGDNTNLYSDLVDNTSKQNKPDHVEAPDLETLFANSNYKAPSPPPPPKDETSAAARWRNWFPPWSLKLKQPEIPGIWGSWDPDRGPQRDDGRGDWPDYEAAVAKGGTNSSRSRPIDQTATADPQSIWELQTTLLRQESRRDGESEIPIAQPMTAHFDATQTQGSADLRYRSPEPDPKRINPDINFRKDAELKRIAANAQHDNTNGPMWGIGSKPPIDFRGWAGAAGPAIHFDDGKNVDNRGEVATMDDQVVDQPQESAEIAADTPGIFKYGAVWSDDKTSPPKGDRRGPSLYSLL